MKINSLVVNNVGGVFGDPVFVNMLEQYMSQITSTPIGVDPYLVYKHEGNLYGLLHEIGVPVWLHWLTMRLNGFKNPCLVDEDIVVIHSPDVKDVEKLVGIYNTSNKKTLT